MEKHEHEHACGCEGGCENKNESSQILWIRLGVAALLVGAALLFEDALGIWVTAVYAIAWLIAGNDIALNMYNNIRKGIVFDENLLMVTASAGALCIGEGAEGLAVVLLYQVGEWLQHRAAERSRRHIAAGFELRPDFANLLDGDDGATARRVGVDALEPDDYIIIRAGERVPADCVATGGGSSFDTSALTGESAPRDISVGDELLAGFIAIDGAMTARVLRRSSDSAAASVERLLRDAEKRRAPQETFIRRFAGVYTPVVCALALCVAVIPPLFVGDWTLWLHRALTFLVVSCPCALVISVPLSYYAGIGGSARLGVIVRGGAALETLAAKRLAVAFDKTGTLTEGRFEVCGVTAYGNVSTEYIIALAAAAERGSSHPIAEAIVRANETEIIGWSDGNEKPVPLRYTATEIDELAGFGLRAVIDGKTVLVGNLKLMRSEGVECGEEYTAGTAVYVAADGACIGAVAVADVVRHDAHAAVQSLRRLGVLGIAMVTGDVVGAACAAAAQCGIDDVRHSLLPGGKVDVVESLKRGGRHDVPLYGDGPPDRAKHVGERDVGRGRTHDVGRVGERRDGRRTVVFVGDGINDAPSLMAADIGIAMANGANRLAVDAADAVIMGGSPLRVADAIVHARRTARTVRINVAFALAFKAAVLTLSVLGYATMWAAVAADVGVSLLCVANALRLLRTK